MVDNITDVLPAGDSALFDAYLMMLDSDSFIGGVLEGIREGNWAPGALRATAIEHIRAFNEMEDPYLRERAEDVRDLSRRVLQRLQRKKGGGATYPRNTVLVGEEISASMLAEVPPKRLTAVVSVRGSRTSHTAILARALGIPAVLGVDDLPVARVDAMEVIVDGYSGRVYVNAPNEIKREYKRLKKEEQELTDELQELRDVEAATEDGVHIPLYANTGLVSDIRPSIESGAEGIGLYRTEFPFMIRERFPGEEEQRQVYRQVLESFAPRPVTMRTLDVGGDKALPYFPIEEDNPFLGWRGIRITLDHPEIFLVQIRAMLKANVGLNNLRLLLPMISTLSEVDEAKALIHRAYQELLEEGEAVTLPQVGAMVEVPSVIYQIEPLARRVDFLSVGSNDLTQYLLAVDRNNARVADLYDSLHPAVIQALRTVVEGAKKHRLQVSVCGEMAGDPVAALLLLGLGVNSLSMSASSLLRVKWVIRSFSRRRAKALAKKVMEMEDSQSIRNHLQKVLEKAGLGGLVRAGK
jgi:phosphotransferase system enzyme I (PtsP)